MHNCWTSAKCKYTHILQKSISIEYVSDGDGKITWPTESQYYNKFNPINRLWAMHFICYLHQDGRMVLDSRLSYRIECSTWQFACLYLSKCEANVMSTQEPTHKTINNKRCTHTHTSIQSMKMYGASAKWALASLANNESLTRFDSHLENETQVVRATCIALQHTQTFL